MYSKENDFYFLINYSKMRQIKDFYLKVQQKIDISSIQEFIDLNFFESLSKTFMPPEILSNKCDFFFPTKYDLYSFGIFLVRLFKYPIFIRFPIEDF